MPLVTNQAGRKKRVPGFVWWGLVLIVLVFVAVTAFHYYEEYRSQQEFAQIQTQTESLEAQGNFAQIASLWAGYASDNSNDKSHRAQAWQKAADAYMSEGDWKDGLHAYQQAEALTGLTYEEAAGAAQAAMRLHENDLAVHYLQMELKLLPKDLSLPQLQRQLIEKQIQQMKQAQ